MDMRLTEPQQSGAVKSLVHVAPDVRPRGPPFLVFLLVCVRLLPHAGLFELGALLRLVRPRALGAEWLLQRALVCVELGGELVDRIDDVLWSAVTAM